MPDLAVFSARWVPLAVAVSLILAAPSAAALSRRDQTAVDAINQRMGTAEQRYRDAQVRVGNNDPSGVPESNAALEDIEDVIDACIKQKGCAIADQIAVYKRLLKRDIDVDAEVADGDGDSDIDPMDPDPDHADNVVAAGAAGAVGAVPESAKAASLLDDHRHRFDKMVQYNPAVQAGIRRWLTDLRPSLIASHDNYEYMREQMYPSYERAGLPEALLFGIMAKESNGKVHVSSRAGAAGLMQFMPATGRRFGLGDDGTGFDTRFDPRSAAQASADYLNERMGELNNSIEMALAAYNGGEGRALRVYKSSGGGNFWDADVYNQFPAETRDYVPMVIAAAWLFLHPKKYGLSFPKADGKPAQLRLEKPSSLYELTICLGNGGSHDGYLRALRNLNPRSKPDAWLAAGTTINATTRMATLYGRYCVNGSRALLAQQLINVNADTAIVRVGETTPMPPVSTYVPGAGEIPTTVATGKPAKVVKATKYKVSKGDTLVSIAKEHSCDTKSLAKANGIKAPRYAIQPGQTLKLASCDQ